MSTTTTTEFRTLDTSDRLPEDYVKAYSDFKPAWDKIVGMK